MDEMLQEVAETLGVDLADLQAILRIEIESLDLDAGAGEAVRRIEAYLDGKGA